MPRRFHAPANLKPKAILAVSFGAVLLGGASTPAALALVILAGSVVALLWPPEHRAPKPIGALLLAAALVPVLAYLPAAWTSDQSWRDPLAASAQLAIPWTTTPQPWVTLDAWLHFAAACGWLYYLACQRWSDSERAQLVRGLAVGIVGIATVSLALKAISWSPPLWDNPQNFGPLDNRNRFATLLAVGAVLLATTTRHEFDRKKVRWLYWPLGVLPLLAAIIANHSRAGILLFFAGLLVWLVVSVSAQSPSKSLALGTAFLLVLASGFFVFGGELRERILTSGVTGAGFDSTHRLLIYQDVPRIIGSSPFVGHGLGSFDSVFPFHRAASLDILRQRISHPENDALWIGAEGGLLLLAVVAAVAIAVFVRTFPLRFSASRRAARPVRIGALVACAVIVAHGAIDVPAHTPALFLLLALLASLAISDQAKKPSGPGSWSRPLRLLPPAFAAVSIAGLGGTLLPLPGATAASKHADWQLQEVPEATTLTAALAYRPLDWQLYFNRARTHLDGGALADARLDFARARSLAPESMQLAAREAELWQTVDPSSAVHAWTFIITHHEDYAVSAYNSLLDAAKESPGLLVQAREIAQTETDFLLMYFGRLPTAEFLAELEELLARDPALRTIRADRLPSLFKLWYAKGDRERLLQGIGETPGWWKAGWPLAAQDLASKNRHQEAVEIALANARRPPVTDLTDHRTIGELRRDVVLHPEDPLTGLYLFDAERRLGNLFASERLINKIAELETAPDYIPYYQAQAQARIKKWPEAWISIQQYNRAYPPH